MPWLQAPPLSLLAPAPTYRHSCKDPTTSVVVQITDACPCGPTPSNATHAVHAANSTNAVNSTNATVNAANAADNK